MYIRKKKKHHHGIKITNITHQKVFLTTPHSFAIVNLKPLLPGHVLVCPTRPHRRLTDLSPPEVTDLFAAVQEVERMLARHYFSSSLPPPSASGRSSPPPPPPPAPAPAPAVAGEGEAENKNGGGRLEEAGGSFNIAVQDGPEAGQTVAHVHVHVIPRIRGLSSKPEDAPGDELYERMAAEEGNVGGALWDREAAAAAAGAGGGGRPVAGGKFDRIEDIQRGARSMGEMEAEAEVFRRVLREMRAEDEGGA